MDDLELDDSTLLQKHTNKGGRPKGAKDKQKRLPRCMDREKRQQFLVALTDPAKTQFKDTAEALKFLLARECELPDFNGMSNREALARVLLTFALKGDSAALKIVLDRADGKLLDTPPLSIGTVIVHPDFKDPNLAAPELKPEFTDVELLPAPGFEELG